MLKLKGITKIYEVGDSKIHALKGVDLNFRRSEFVSILGPSGCGKTTLLNIIGGLDRYTEGDLFINGKSTKEFTDSDWDAYRNNSIGFVFQNYNLISHQTVLFNVELALTLSGVSKEERRKRAIEALESVGLSDQLKKKPNQLSGGQMQRVAIARAIVNNPDILLADEPTGALDSVTSLQIMEILEKLSKDKLVIMVTHNSDLAYKSSNRIITALDGLIVDDSNPLESQDAIKNESNPLKKEIVVDNDSGNNQAHVNSNLKVKSDSLTENYAQEGAQEKSADKKVVKNEKKSKKLQLKKTSMSFFTALILSLKNLLTKKTRTILTSFAGSIGIIGIALVLALSNGFSAYITKLEADTLSAYPITISQRAINTSAISSMMADPDTEKFTKLEVIYVNKILDKINEVMKRNTITNKYIDQAVKTINPDLYYAISYQMGIKINVYTETKNLLGNTIYSEIDTGEGWSELIDGEDFILSQYEILKGGLPTDKSELVLVVDSFNQVTDIALMSLGLYSLGSAKSSYTFDEIMAKEFKLISNNELYVEDYDLFKKRTNITESIFSSGETLKIAGILRLKGDTVAGAINTSVAYSHLLTEYVLDKEKDSAVVQAQLANPDYDILTGEEFDTGTGADTDRMLSSSLRQLSAGDTPVSINIYPVSFDSKVAIKKHLDEYNNAQTDELDRVYYTDIMELIMTAMTRIINIVTYVLIAFTAISLVVSSIMIGIITYISVIERTKEIGILRSIGARKKDISRVFNAETLIIGFVAGTMGVLITILLTIPINLIIAHFVDGIENLAVLNPLHAIILVAISMSLTLIAGLIPSKIAANKDPVEALRTE